MNTKANILIGFIILLVASATVSFLLNRSQLENKDGQSMNETQKNIIRRSIQKIIQQKLPINTFHCPLVKK
jgi:hypothetical protein